MTSQGQAFCFKCGKLQPAGGEFCMHCGAALGNVPSAPTGSSTRTTKPTEKESSDVRLKLFAIVVVIYLVGFGLSKINAWLEPPRASSQQTQAAPTPTTPSIKQMTVRKEGIGCRTKGAMERLLSMVSANDGNAVASMLLSGQCEMIPLGVVLDAEDLSIFGPSRYRIRGTQRSLYVIESSLQ
jgi:hypothetical protein